MILFQDRTVSVQANRERERLTLLTTLPIPTTIPAAGPTTGTPTVATTRPDHRHRATHRRPTAPLRPERQPRGIRTTSYRGYRRRSFRRPSSTSSRLPSSSSISLIRPVTAPATCPHTADLPEHPNSASPSLPADTRTRPWRCPEPTHPATTSSAVVTTADSTTTSRLTSRFRRLWPNGRPPPAPVRNSNLSSRSKSNRIYSPRATAITAHLDRIGVRSLRPLASKENHPVLLFHPPS